MAIYDVQAPDGSILEIEGPDNATDEQIQKFAATQFRPKSDLGPRGADGIPVNGYPSKEAFRKDALASLSPAELAAVQPRQSRSPSANVGLDARDMLAQRSPFSNPEPQSRWDALKAQTGAVANEATRFAVGVAKPVVGAARLIADSHPLSMQARDEGRRTAAQKYIFDPMAENFKETDKILNPSGEFDVPGFAGEIMSPLSLKGSQLASTAKSVLGKTAQGATFGGVMGAVQDDQKALEGAGMGAAISLPLAVVSKYVGKPVAELMKYYFPFDKKGAERIANKYKREIVGEENMNKIVADIEEQLGRAGTGTNVPGYQKTVGEMVSHMPEASPLQALQKQGASRQGGTSALYFQRELDQQKAIKDALRTVAKTPEELESAVASRGALAAEEYGAAARKLKIDDELKRLLGDPYFKKIEQEARDMSVSSGKKDMTSFLQNAKSLLSTTAREAKDPKERMLVGNVERKLTDWLADANPQWNTARENFKQRSIPINQMQVGQQIEKKLMSPADQMMPGGYLRAIQDETATIKNATGQPRSSFGQVFNTQQKQTLDEIGNLLENKLAANKPLQGTHLDTKDIAAAKMIQLPRLLDTKVSMTNWLLRMATGGKSKLENHIDEINSLQMLDPKKFVEAMKDLPPTQRELIAKQLSLRNQGLIAPAVMTNEEE
jgi:hypothetical protein